MTDSSPPYAPVTDEYAAHEVTRSDEIPESAKYPCGKPEPHAAHDWIGQTGVIDYEHYWCVGVEAAPASSPSRPLPLTAHTEPGGGA